MNEKQNKGITLVALVITIIVLIILAGVSINAVMNGGLITNAKEAKNEWQEKTVLEQVELAKLELQTAPEIKAGQSAGDGNKRYTEGGKTAIVPKGFTVSGIASEKTISGGLVIYSMDEETASNVNWETGKDANGNIVQETYNQYVWIPVDDINDMVGTVEVAVEGIEGTKFGKLYDANSSRTELNVHLNWPSEENFDSTGYREPAIASTSPQSEKDSLLNLYGEFNDMIKSVEACKGFYIARYELTGDAISTPTVCKGKNPLNNVTWYDLYSACTKLEEDNNNVRTTMVWGCQWDQAQKKCLSYDEDFLTGNAKHYGVYSDSEIKGAGVTGRMQPAYNIYDMGGNYWDFTLEEISTGSRVLRGGDSDNASDEAVTDYRLDQGVLFETNNACRAQLFIEI